MLGDRFVGCLEGAQAGEQDAFAVLFNDLEAIVYRYLRVLSSSAAEDLAADTWLDVVRGLQGFSGDETHFKAWVLTIARHRYVDGLRRQARQPSELPFDESLLAWASTPDTSVIVEENLCTQSALALVAKLPRAQADVVILRAVVGLSVAEVAAVVGRQPTAVRALAHRGLRRLAQLMAHESGGLVSA